MPSRRGRPRSRIDQVGAEALGREQRLGAVAGALDLVALGAQRAAQDVGDRLVVLDDEHARGAVAVLARALDQG